MNSGVDIETHCGVASTFYITEPLSRAKYVGNIEEQNIREGKCRIYPSQSQPTHILYLMAIKKKALCIVVERFVQ